jgi:hypothetical protein
MPSGITLLLGFVDGGAGQQQRGGDVLCIPKNTYYNPLVANTAQNESPPLFKYFLKKYCSEIWIFIIAVVYLLLYGPFI